jgi:hypothetical protein
LKIDLNAFVCYTGADAVNAVKSQGAVKHYTVMFTFPKADKVVIEKLEKLWPFGEVAQKSDGSVTAEYLVRPDEVNSFCKTLTQACLPRKKNAAVALRFPDGIPDSAKHKVRSLIRSTDRIVWNGDEAVIFLEGCKDPTAVERRIRKLLSGSLSGVDLEVDVVS